jgi:hypothetical protein
MAVTHRPVDQQLVLRQRPPERVGQLDALLAGDRAQRRFVPLPVPDRRVRLAAAGWPRGQDDQVQQRLPDQRVDVDHALVAKELLQIAAHRPVVGRIRRAEVQQQHADPLRIDHRMFLRQRRRRYGRDTPIQVWLRRICRGIGSSWLPHENLRQALAQATMASAAETATARDDQL